MTNEEQYTIDTTPFRVKIDEPGPNGHPLRKWNALKLNIDRHKTVWDEGGAGVYPEELYPQSKKKVWAVCIQCGKGRWVMYFAYHHLCRSCSQYGDRCSEETRKKRSAALSGEKHPMFGKHPSEETRKKMSDARSGENHYNFGKHLSEETRIKSSCTRRGIPVEEFPGFTHEKYVLFIMSGEYANWRIAVFERDNYTCQECGAYSSGDLQAHHITPFHLHPEPEYSLDIDNGITLCKMCHDKVRGHEDEFYNKYTAIVKANSGFKDDFLSSSVILEGLEKQNDLHSTHQPTIFDY